MQTYAAELADPSGDLYAMMHLVKQRVSDREFYLLFAAEAKPYAEVIKPGATYTILQGEKEIARGSFGTLGDVIVPAGAPLNFEFRQGVV